MSYNPIVSYNVVVIEESRLLQMQRPGKLLVVFIVVHAVWHPICLHEKAGFSEQHTQDAIFYANTWDHYFLWMGYSSFKTNEK